MREDDGRGREVGGGRGGREKAGLGEDRCRGSSSLLFCRPGFFDEFGSGAGDGGGMEPVAASMKLRPGGVDGSA